MLLGRRFRCIDPACRRNWSGAPRPVSGRKFSGCPVKLQAHPVNDSQKFIPRTRNIGIIAHIDAGKTTTTERILYYSGYTRRIGDVDEGSTVTDFLPAERARGITIQSAAITFHWPPLGSKDNVSEKSRADVLAEQCTINLIDTPGHADFTFEVLRSLRILDGAVCILDGVAGVEAQTEKVWAQAQTYKIPKLIYVNKLDRDGASFAQSVRDIASKLHVWPAVCHIPWFENRTGRFQGIVDVVNLKALKWPSTGDGKSIESMSMAELDAKAPDMAEEAGKARLALTELLSEHDDHIVEKFLEYDEDHMSIAAGAITASLRRCLLRGSSNIVPVFAGASFRNIGVQPLIDAVTDLLPGPEEAPDPHFTAGKVEGGLKGLLDGSVLLPEQGKRPQKPKKGSIPAKSGNASVEALEACALAFKVVNNPRRGVLVYVRVYHGAITRGSMLFNTNLQTSERAPRLLTMYASDAVEIPSIPAGHIGVITGLKYARTGDTLISCTGMNPKSGPPEPLNQLQLRPIEVPPPVFFASIEPQSRGEERAVETALEILLREDPSLQLSTDEESGQRMLSGMGELHLEIARDRLLGDLKAKAKMGEIEIGYRECLLAPGGPVEAIFERETAGKYGKAGAIASVEKLSDSSTSGDTAVGEETTLLELDGNVVRVDIVQPEADEKSRKKRMLPFGLTREAVRQAIINGVLAALGRGPQFSFQLRNTYVKVTFDTSKHIFGPETTLAAISSAARTATFNAIRTSHQSKPTALMEPIMNVVIGLDEASLGAVVHDLSSSRSGQVLSLDDAPAAASMDDSGDEAGVPSVDGRRVYAPPDPFESEAGVRGSDVATTSVSHRQRNVTARVPLKEMVGYLKHLRSLTAGRGTFVMSVDCFERVNSQRERLLLKEIRGEF